MGVFDRLLGEVSTALGGMNGQQSGIAGSVMQLIQSQPGGLQGLVTTFREKGLGDVVGSWVSTGQNLPISADQIQHVLGNEKLQQLAIEHGIDVTQISSHLSQLLPTLVDRMTPNGQLPQGDLLGGLKSLLGGSS